MLFIPPPSIGIIRPLNDIFSCFAVVGGGGGVATQRASEYRLLLKKKKVTGFFPAE